MKKKFFASLAPILLFTYNRLNHLKKTINSLKKNKLYEFSDLIIFSDGARSKSELKKIKEVRNFIKKIKGFKSLKIYNRNKNYGLSKNVINGVTKVLKLHKTVIVLEDDLVLDKFFLDYMNQALKLFKSNRSIASIHGYIYPIRFDKKIPEYFLIKGADCWGWATWRRAWKKFDSNGDRLKKIIDKQKNKREFNFNNSFNYYKMLINQINGKNNSWAIRWYASAFVNNMFTLYPAKTFVKNIGADGTGTHGGGNRNVNNENIYRKKFSSLKKNKISTSENLDAKKKIENYFNNKTDFSIKKIIKKIIRWK